MGDPFARLMFEAECFPSLSLPCRVVGCSGGEEVGPRVMSFHFTRTHVNNPTALRARVYAEGRPGRVSGASSKASSSHGPHTCERPGWPAAPGPRQDRQDRTSMSPPCVFSACVCVRRVTIPGSRRRLLPVSGPNASTGKPRTEFFKKLTMTPPLFSQKKSNQIVCSVILIR